MTLERIKAVFAALPNCAAWSLQLLKINTSKQNRTSYTGRKIALFPEGTLASLLQKFLTVILMEAKGCLTPTAILLNIMVPQWIGLFAGSIRQTN